MRSITDAQRPHATNAHKAICALLAGALAITVNTALLVAADRIPLVTARGGLLKLLKLYLGYPLVWVGIGPLWSELELPDPGSYSFQLGFHVAAGLAMALFYGLALEPWLPGPAWVKGVTYAAVVWAANAFVVLPWLGEGIAGNRYLGPAGMAYFAVAHTVFFLLLTILFARLLHLVDRRRALARADT